MKPSPVESLPGSALMQMMRSFALVSVHGLTWLRRSKTRFGDRASKGGITSLAGVAAPTLVRPHSPCPPLVPPPLLRHRPLPSASPIFDARACELARLLLSPTPVAACVLVRDSYAVAGSLVHLLTLLVEPAARKLGDLWRDDDCSEVEVAVGLYHLLRAVRRLDVGRPASQRLFPRVALLVPQPGERDVLGTALSADLAWQAGWDAEVAFPATDEALAALVAHRWFDLLNLSLSLAFSRHNWVDRMAVTIARTRRSSLNANLVVVVNGRLFQENEEPSGWTGADFVVRSAAQFKHLLTHPAGQQR